MIPLSDSVKSERFPFINLTIIAITVYVFFLQMTASDPEAFVYQWALVPATVNLSDPQTLIPFISSMFLHGGFLHIISNMLFLWVFGDNVEGHYPPFVYLFLYLVSGLIGGISQFVLMPDSSIPMLGASGAVAGALGAYFALFPHHKVRTLIPVFGFFTIAEISASFMLGYWIVLQILSGVISLPGSSGAEGGIAFFAHIGGFAFGYLFAKVFPGRRVHEAKLLGYE
jgi:membrane associated rhomboid family serine protease